MVCSGNCKQAIQELLWKGKKALFKMKSLYPIPLNTKLKTSLKLFETLIQPIITYCCEIWGSSIIENEDNNCLEVFHSQFCKQILGLNKMACNSAAKAELGRYPIVTSIIPRLLKFYAHLHSSENEILKNCIIWQQQQLTQYPDPKHTKNLWMRQIKKLFDNNGLSYMYSNPSLIDQNISLIKQRVKDIFIQNWISKMEDDSTKIRNRTCGNKLRTYRTFKKVYQFEQYLSDITCIPKRINLTKFRVSNHRLRIESGRYEKLDVKERICQYCTLGEIDDEDHFIFNCQFHTEDRKMLYNNLGLTPKDISNQQTHVLSVSQLLLIPETHSVQAIADFINKGFIKRQQPHG